MRKKIIQRASIISIAILGSFLSLPFLTYADAAPNLIANPGLETANSTDATFPEHWNKGFWGAHDALFTYPVPGVNGTKAAKVEISSYTNGDAKWFFEDVSVHPGEQYMFSDYYLANIPADVVARYTLSSGSYQYAYLGTSVVSTAWTGYATLPFTVPKDAVSLTVFHLIHETGSLSIDNVYLRQLPTIAAAPKTLSASTLSEINGGVVPLSYLTHTAPAPTGNLFALPAALSNLSNNTEQQSTIIHQDFAVSAPQTNTQTEAVKKPKSLHVIHIPDTVTSFINSAEAAVQTPSIFSPSKANGVAPLGMFDGNFYDLSFVFVGLALILLSTGLSTLLLASSNRK